MYQRPGFFVRWRQRHAHRSAKANIRAAEIKQGCHLKKWHPSKKGEFV
jgi:hypothetical protein